MQSNEAKHLAKQYGIGSLIGVGSNAKTEKSDKGGEYLTGICYLSPADEVARVLADPDLRILIGEKYASRLDGRDIPTTCPWASPGCKSACLYTAGRGRMDSVWIARVRRTIMFHFDRAAFIALFEFETAKHVARCDRLGVIPAIRPDGTSDILIAALWAHGTFDRFPTVQWYGYSKSSTLATRDLGSNVDMTYSRSETNETTALEVLRQGGRVAAVFSERPATYKGFATVDGDLDDLTFTQPKGSIIGLVPKGSAKVDNSGFVINI